MIERMGGEGISRKSWIGNERKSGGGTGGK